MANSLICKAQRIAHTAIGSSRQGPECGIFKGHLLFTENKLQMFGNTLGTEVFQIELQASRQHRNRQLLRIRGGEQKLYMWRWLFEGF